jgi:hypothetical protein
MATLVDDPVPDQLWTIVEPLLPSPEGCAKSDVAYEPPVRVPGSAAREHMILRIGGLSRKNEHVNLRVVCPHHCSGQRIPSPHSEPQGTASVQHPPRRPSMQVERSLTCSSGGMRRFASRGWIGHRCPFGSPSGSS